MNCWLDKIPAFTELTSPGGDINKIIMNFDKSHGGTRIMRERK